MAPTKRKKTNRENANLARVALAAKRRKIEELQVAEPAQPEGQPSTLNTLEEEAQQIPPESSNSGQQTDAEMIDAAIITEVMITPPSNEVAAAEHNGDETNDIEGKLSAQNGPEEPDENILLFMENGPPEIQADASHDALVEENHTLQNSVDTVLSPYKNAPIPRDIAADALKRLDFILYPSKCARIEYKPPKLDSMFSVRRLTAMAACLRFYTNSTLGWTLTHSSEIAAIGAGYGIRFGKKIRQFVRAFINTDDLPENQYGTWNVSVLEDEDLATELKEYLVECKGRYMRAEDIVEYLQRPDVKRRFGLDGPPSIRTAQRWLKGFGFRWGEDPKGQYVDGHEREDVVKYRNENFIPIWDELERRMGWYDSKTMEYHVPALEPGERIVMVWFHDESMFYANDRRLTRWVHLAETAQPYAKGEGASIMVADFVGIEGWLHGSNPADNSRIVLFPGKTRDGYLTGEKVRKQLTKAIEIVQAKYPHAEHVFIYDNATTHTKRREDLAIISKMTLGPSSNFGEVVEERTGEDGKVVKIRTRYADTHFADGSPQFLYFPDDHPTNAGKFKGIANLLQERGFEVKGLKLQCAAPKKCVPTSGCCARQLLSEQPGFTEQQSALEEIAEASGCRILFLPKFHCELNPIEQCWGYAKRVYRQFPRSKSQADLKSNMLASLDSIPVESIRRFFNKSQRYIDAYRRGMDGQMAAWANKKYRGHRMLPPNILHEVEAEFRRQTALSAVESNTVTVEPNPR